MEKALVRNGTTVNCGSATCISLPNDISFGTVPIIKILDSSRLTANGLRTHPGNQGEKRSMLLFSMQTTKPRIHAGCRFRWVADIVRGGTGIARSCSTWPTMEH